MTTDGRHHLTGKNAYVDFSKVTIFWSKHNLSYLKDIIGEPHEDDVTASFPLNGFVRRHNRIICFANHDLGTAEGVRQ